MIRVPFEARLAVRGPNLVLLGVALVLWAAALAAAVAWTSGAGIDLLLIAGTLAVAGGLAVARVLHGRRLGSAVAAVVRVNGDGLHINDDRIALAAVTRAVYVPRGAGPEAVRVTRWGGLVVDVLVNSRSEAELLLAALGYGVDQRTVTFRAHSNIVNLHTRVLVVGALGALCVGALSGVLPAAVTSLGLAAAAAFLLLGVVPTRVDVGADGLHARCLGMRRFIPSSQIAYTSRYTAGWGRNTRHGLHVYVSDAEPLDLVFGSSEGALDELAAFEARVDLLRAPPPHDDLGSVRTALSRAGRSTEAWLRDLRALGHPTARGYRTATVAPELLAALVERGDIAPEERAAAAVILAATPEPPRERIRVVVDTVADPALRAALDAAAGDDDAALSRALDALSARAAAA